MMFLLFLQLLASCLWLGHNEVVQDFSRCPRFFFRRKSPNNALQPKNASWICQVYKNRYYFATLYNKDLRIPVYSAYIYKPGTGKRPNFWMVEPQLVNSSYNKSMMKQDDLITQFNVSLQDIKDSQAISDDYNNATGLHRGHLNPCGHQSSLPSKTATFTLTNIVPQNAQLNMGAWKRYEQKTMKIKSKGCKTTYVVVGTVPGNNFIANGRVNVPSHMWSSACCDMGKNKKTSWAVIAKNDKNAVKSLTVQQLESILTKLYGNGRVSLFHPICPRK